MLTDEQRKYRIVFNANIAHACARCGRKFPRMWEAPDGSVVCGRGDTCRDGTAPTTRQRPADA